MKVFICFEPKLYYEDEMNLIHPNNLMKNTYKTCEQALLFLLPLSMLFNVYSIHFLYFSVHIPNSNE